MLDAFLFVGLPYAAIIIFIVGSILRVRNYGYSVTSHSSQFLEPYNLYWSSRFFHIGIVTILLGHLIGFLIPKTIILLTTKPLGLIIIEISAFAFGLLCFTGFVLLIIRRLRHKRLQVVTSSMDVFVYSIVLLQIITGLLVAYFNRWGSTWYAATLVPYLRSLLTLTPDITVISTMPWLIKIHAISAFLFIGLFPFSRLIHVLVYPFYYFWRRYQFVIWNKDMKESRASKSTREGVKPKNN